MKYHIDKHKMKTKALQSSVLINVRFLGILFAVTQMIANSAMADNVEPTMTDEATIYIAVTDNWTADAKAKIKVLAGSCKVDPETITAKIKALLDTQNISSTKLKEIIDAQINKAKGIIDDYNTGIDRAAEDAGTAIKAEIDKNSPDAKLTNKYKYKSAHKDPGNPGWGESTLDIEGTNTVTVTPKINAKITLTADAGVVVANAGLEFDITAKADLSYVFTLTAVDPLSLNPSNKPTASAGCSMKINTTWSATVGVGFGATVEVGVGAGTNKTITPPLKKDMTAGTVENPPA